MMHRKFVNKRAWRSIIFLLALFFATWVAATQGAELKRKATYADYANYTGHSAGVSLEVWNSFIGNSPGMAAVAKDSLNGIIIHKQLSDGDTKGAFNTLVNFTAGFIAGELQTAGYGPLGSVKTFAEAYIAANEFVHQYYFIPTLVDGVYRRYKELRNSKETHAMVWKGMGEKLPPALIADTKKRVIYPRYNVQKMGSLSEATRKVKGRAGGRDIEVTYHHKENWPYKKRQFLIRHKGKTGIPRFLSVIDIELTGDHKKALSSLMHEITRLNERYRDKGDMSLGDLKAVEKELSRLLEESASAAALGKKLHEEAIQYVGARLKHRYFEDKLKEQIAWLEKKSRQDLEKLERALKTFNWAKRLTIRAKSADGTPGKPVSAAAIFVDGELCTSEKNAGKPCGSGPDGNALVHLTAGTHSIRVKASGYKTAELDITARATSEEKPAPEEYSVLLTPRKPGRLAVLITSGSSGKPLPAAVVMLTSLGSGPVLTSKTGADGKATFNNIPPEDMFLLAMSAAYHHDRDPLPLNPEEFPGPLTVALQPILSTAEIAVLGPDGTSVQNASVVLGDKQATTNHDGVAIFQDVLPTPIEGYNLTAFMPGLGKATSKLMVQPEGQGLLLKATLRLSLDGTIMVSVRDDQNRLVPNAVVRLEGPGSPQSKKVGSAKGMVVFNKLMPGAYYINASAKGYSSGGDREIVLTPDNIKQKTKLVLTSGMKLKVIVVDQDGNTIPAKISVDDKSPVNAPTGVAMLKDVSSGKHKFTVRAKGFPLFQKEYTANPANPKLIVNVGEAAPPEDDYTSNNGFVAFLFRTILDREGNEEEIGQATELLRNGKSREWLIMQLFMSGEYKSKRKSNREFIRDVYQGVLAREPDPSGWSFWTKQLNSSGRKGVIERFFASPEYLCTHPNSAGVRRCQGRRR